MAAHTVVVWTPGGKILVKVNPVTRRVLQTLPKAGGSHSTRDGRQVATLTAHAVTPQAGK